MRVKRMILGPEARTKFKEGIDLVANYVKITLGPKGRNVALNQLGPLPTRIINDGVTIAAEVKSDDPFIQSGVESVQEICRKTNDNAGDGTTQTALLAQIITSEGQKRLVNGYNPMTLKQELDEDLSGLLESLKELSHPVTQVSDVEKVATISGNNDHEIGRAIADVMDKVGLNASIIIEKGSEEAIKTETVKGMYFDKGFRVPAFINNFAKGIAEYKDPYIFIVNESLKWDDEIMDFFQKCLQLKYKNIVLIANEIEGEVLNTLALSHKEKYSNPNSQIDTNILAIEAPFIGPDREDFLSDLAVYTGGKVINKLYEAKPDEVFGTCEKIIATSKMTTILSGAGKKEDVDARVAEIKSLIAQLEPSEKTIKEKMEKRLGTIESGVGIIYSGGKTEIEIRDRYLRLEDAVRASKSAVKEGFVAGGGFTYLQLAKVAKTEILANALKEVVKQIAINAGKSADMVLERCLADNIGYNAKNDSYGDLIADGVIDATLVVKNALQNSVSLAMMFLTTEALIVEEDVPEKKPNFN